jgi:hypothetical protein
MLGASDAQRSIDTKIGIEGSPHFDLVLLECGKGIDGRNELNLNVAAFWSPAAASALR